MEDLIKFLLLVYLFHIYESRELSSDFCEGKGYRNAHPDKCELFVFCSLDIAYVIDCPPGLHWNDAAKVCDWPKFARCQDVSTTTPSTSRPPTTKAPSTTSLPTPTTTFVPGKRKYERAEFCNPSACKLPHCRCAGKDIPGGLSREQTPQMVLVTFDDAIQVRNYNIYVDLFDGTRKNPDGCTIRGTFFVSNEHGTKYKLVEFLSDQGHEIADHSVTQKAPDNTGSMFWRDGSYEALELEILGQRKNLVQNSGVKVQGWRSPFMNPGENTSRVLADNGFLYSSSLRLDKGQIWWPYTQDHLNKNYPAKCNGNCPQFSYPGLWEVPSNPWNEIGYPYMCTHVGGCYRSLEDGNADSVYQLMMKNFLRFYEGNKQPFNVFMEPGFVTHADYAWKRNGLKRFLDEILKKNDVYLVTVSQAIRWVQNPTPLDRIKDFQPWKC